MRAGFIDELQLGEIRKCGELLDPIEGRHPPAVHLGQLFGILDTEESHAVVKAGLHVAIRGYGGRPGGSGRRFDGGRFCGGRFLGDRCTAAEDGHRPDRREQPYRPPDRLSR